MVPDKMETCILFKNRVRGERLEKLADKISVAIQSANINEGNEFLITLCVLSEGVKNRALVIMKFYDLF